MKAKWISAPRPKDLPKCEAETNQYWRRGSDYHCLRRATVNINDVNLCAQHAGAIALAHAINESWSC